MILITCCVRAASRVGEMLASARILSSSWPVSSSGMKLPPAVLATAKASTPVRISRVSGCQRMIRRCRMAQSSARS